MTRRSSRDRLGDQLTLIATMNGSPVGFASLANNETIDLLYVHPAAAGQGVGTMLVDALEKLAAARGAKRLTTEASDTAQDFFKKRGFTAHAAQHRAARRRMARQHHDGKGPEGANAMMQLKAHHVVIGAIAILVAVAMALNYYLW